MMRVYVAYDRDVSPEGEKWRWQFGEDLFSRDFFENVVGVNASQPDRREFVRTGKPIPLTDARKFWDAVSRLPALRGLSIYDDQVTAEDIHQLATKRCLEELIIQTTLVGDDHLREIGQLKELPGWSLALNSTTSSERASISRQGVDHLRALPKLTFLNLSGTTFDDLAAESLADLGNLKSLYLINTAISDDGLRHLASLRKLAVINVSGSLVTRAGSDELQAALPNCRVQNFVPYDPAD